MSTLVTRESAASLPTMTWRAWSCQVRLVVTDAASLEPAAADLATLMDRVDLAASRFRADSELSRANANAGRPTAVSRLLVSLVQTALGEALRSSGALDPALGLDLQRLGYDRDIQLVCDLPAPVPPRPANRPDWRSIRLDPGAGLLTVPCGIALDLEPPFAATAPTPPPQSIGLHRPLPSKCRVAQQPRRRW